MATRGRKQSVSAQDILLTMINDAINDVSNGNYLGHVASGQEETAPAQAPSTYGYLQAARAAAPATPAAPVESAAAPVINTAPVIRQMPDAYQPIHVGLPPLSIYMPSPAQQNAPVQSFSPLNTEVRPDVVQAQERYNAAMGIYDYPVQEEAGFRFTAPIPIPYPATTGPVANSNALLNTHAPAATGGLLENAILRNGYDYIQSADNRSPVQITTR
jgi:hypothetical protein|nr:MAG TPA: hypothetical protein [Caudoviricetes sp.]